MTRIRVVDFASARRQNTTYTSRLPDSATIAMDSDLIKLVNRLQDTFNDLGMCMGLGQWAINLFQSGGELDMPQLVVVSHADLSTAED